MSNHRKEAESAMKKVILAVVGLMLAVRSHGETWIDSETGIEWGYSVVDGGATIWGNGRMSGDVVIPVSVAGWQVTNMGGIFGAEALTSVVIPEGVTNIVDDAFFNCTSLTNVVIPEGVVNIGMSAFGSCYALTSVTIPSSVRTIGYGAFADGRSLKDVYIESADVEINDSRLFSGDWDLIIHVPSDWKGRGKTLCGYTVERAGESQAVNNVNLTVTNVVIQYVLNSIQPNIAIPISGDTGFVTVITEVKSSGAVSVPTEWSDNYPSFTTKFGTDFGKALAKKSGKKDGAGNDMFVWQDYVAGTDPTNPDDKFTASITLVDGVPVISYTPELTAEQQALRTYKTLGKKQLQDKDWDDLTNVDGDGKKAYNFFKVTVEMK